MIALLLSVGGIITCSCEVSTFNSSNKLAVLTLYVGFLCTCCELELTFLVVQFLAIWPGFLHSKHLPSWASRSPSVVGRPNVLYFLFSVLVFGKWPKLIEFLTTGGGGPSFCAAVTFGSSCLSDFCNCIALTGLNGLKYCALCGGYCGLLILVVLTIFSATLTSSSKYIH